MTSDTRPAATDDLGTVPEQTPPRPVGIGALGWARWAWRQLTSMRTALVLLFLLALAAVPGSTFPQRGVDPGAVTAYYREHPSLAPWLDRMSMFDVFTSPWFAAIYLLLFASLVGCVLPRSRQHWRAMRAQPPAAPRHLDRLPVARRWETDAPVADVVAGVRDTLRRSRFRVRTDDTAVSAEKGYLRETGNLLFHLSLIVLLVALAWGRTAGFRADVIVVEGAGFSNAVPLYDTFEPGLRFDERSLTPFSVRLEDLDVRYQEGGDQSGAPRDFRAAVLWRPGPDQPLRPATITPNHPLVVDGTKVFLLGNGYAPRITVRDRAGRVTFSGAVPFLPREGDGGMTSSGVVRVSDAPAADQLGLVATLLPTAVDTPLLGPVSVFPDTRNPRLFVTAVWRGDLGLDAGAPQNVFRLDTSRMIRLAAGDEPLTAQLAPGTAFTLPDGLGTVTFDGVSRFASFQVANDPGRWWAFGGAVLAIAGLMASLFVRRRRVFVRVLPADGGSAPDGRHDAPRTVVAVGALSRSDDAALARDVDGIVETLQHRAPARDVPAAEGEGP